MPQPDWEELDRRVAHLEKLMGVEPAPLSALAGAAPAEAKAQHTAIPAEVNPTALLPILGRALLGLAGAYLLRAVTESAAISPASGVAAGILYAVFWLSWAARTPAANRLETAIHSLTAVLVLCPLLWEATLRFHAISTWAAAATLVLFVVFGLTVSWRKNLLTVATIVTLAGLTTAAGLLIATRDVMPFTLVFLAIAAAVEISSCLEHWLSERWLAALAADLAVLLATWLVTREHGLPEGYAAIPYVWLLGAQVALLAIYLASTIVRTLLRGLNFTWFETAQCAAAFLIGVGGGLRLSRRRTSHRPAFALACAAACYVVSFALLDRAAAAAATSTPIPPSAFSGAGRQPHSAGGRHGVGGLVRAGSGLHLGGHAFRTPDVAGARGHLPAAGAGRVRRAAASGGVHAGIGPLVRREPGGGVGRADGGGALLSGGGARPQFRRVHQHAGVSSGGSGHLFVVVGRCFGRCPYCRLSRRLRGGGRTSLLCHSANCRAGRSLAGSRLGGRALEPGGTVAPDLPGHDPGRLSLDDGGLTSGS